MLCLTEENIVLSSQDITFPGAECFHSLKDALEACKDEIEVFIIGGASLYKEAMPIADRLYITEVDDCEKEADAFFPEISPEIWQEKSRECHSTDEKHLYSYSFCDYDRIK